MIPNRAREIARTAQENLGSSTSLGVCGKRLIYAIIWDRPGYLLVVGGISLFGHSTIIWYRPGYLLVVGRTSLFGHPTIIWDRPGYLLVVG